MLTVEVAVEPDLDPGESSMRDRQRLQLAAQPRQRACLRVYSLRGAVVSLGRYHLAPSSTGDARVALHRADRARQRALQPDIAASPAAG
jgi:hypothetical protein